MNIVLLFGPGHGTALSLPDDARPEVLWQEPSVPTFYANDAAVPRQVMHRYFKFDDVDGSSDSEDCVLYVHGPKCCRRTMPGVPDDEDTIENMLFRKGQEGLRKIANAMGDAADQFKSFAEGFKEHGTISDAADLKIHPSWLGRDI